MQDILFILAIMIFIGYQAHIESEQIGQTRIEQGIYK